MVRFELRLVTCKFRSFDFQPTFALMSAHAQSVNKYVLFKYTSPTKT